jgi:hypothetical protein
LAQKPEPRTIVTAGTVVDGKGLARFHSPQPDGGHVAFQATGDTVTLPEGDGIPAS